MIAVRKDGKINTNNMNHSRALTLSFNMVEGRKNVDRNDECDLAKYFCSYLQLIFDMP
jgi:hypothetical protein